MMSAGPKMYVIAEFEELEKEFLKNFSSRTYEIVTDDDWKYNLLTPLSFNSEQQSLNETFNLAESVVIKVNWLCSLVQYSPNSMMVCGRYKAIVVGVDKMDLLKAINIKAVPFVSAHMIPGSDYKFMLEFDNPQFVYLCNVETG